MSDTTEVEALRQQNARLLGEVERMSHALNDAARLVESARVLAYPQRQRRQRAGFRGGRENSECGCGAAGAESRRLP